ncbi:MAG: preprotein translocase subunit YajC [Thermodesulfobacteriota bacterium]|nr:preprotein translocase subunit YajC [Thermodesulfobacteriota bacterium]
MIDTAYALGGMWGGMPGAGGDWSFMLVMAILFAIFYFLLIRPQQQKQKELKAMLANLAHGDMVVTSGGIHGKVVGLTDTIVTLEIADKIKIKISRSFIAAVLQKAGKE